MTPGASSQIELSAVPALGGVYRAGLGDAIGSFAARVPPVRALAGPGRVARLPQARYLVDGVRGDRDQLTAYQQMLGEPVNDQLPAGYLHVLTFPLATALMVRPESTLPLLGMVHLANDVQVWRPVELGEIMQATAWVENLRGHRRGVQVDSVAELRVGTELVWRGVSTYLAKGTRMPVEASAPADQPEPAQPFAFDGPPTARWHLDGGTGRRYAAISGDRNPIHLSVLTARPLGFRRPIAHGMYTAARALAMVRPRQGGYRWQVSFSAPVFLPSSVNLQVTAVGKAIGYRASPATGENERQHFVGSVQSD